MEIDSGKRFHHSRPQYLSISSGDQSRTDARSRANLWIGLFIVLQVVLGLTMAESSRMATLHALLTVLIGVLVALTTRKMERAIYIAAYIASADVLWRMTGAAFFWEGSKYATALILGITFIRFYSPENQNKSWLPLLYFLLLIPSTIITINDLGINENSRQQISFNLSGPFALAISALCLAHWRPRTRQLIQMLLFFVAPFISISSIVFYRILNETSISFSLESNFSTSGGYGPNQVSAILGLGAVIVTLLFLFSQSKVLRLVLVLIILAFLSQSVLTFSRGGVLNAIISLGLLFIHSISEAKFRSRIFILITILLLAGGYWIIPRLNAYTSGILVDRFSSLETTNRSEIVLADLNLWQENLLFGVGPGMAKYWRGFFYTEVAAHTEFTRLLAEHGIFGLMALFILIGLLLKSYRRAPTILAKGWVALLGGWVLAEMSHSAMRISVISFLFGLAFLTWDTVGEEEAIRG